MSELLITIKDFNLHNTTLVTWAVAGVIVLMALALQKIWIKEFLSEWKLNRLLKNIGLSSLHNITIADDIDGKIFIENLILTPNKIILLGVKKYRGLIFAAETIDLWTQVIDNKSYKFDNPLRQLERDASILNSKIENSKVEEKVLFIKGSEFPKGKPENIVEIADVKQWKDGYNASELSDVLRADWETLSELADNDDLSKNKGVLLDEENTSGLNVFSLVTFTTILFFWLYWRLM